MGGSVRVPKSLQIFAENRVCALSDLTSCALLAFSCHLTVFSSSGANYAGPGGGVILIGAVSISSEPKGPWPTSACNVGIEGFGDGWKTED